MGLGLIVGGLFVAPVAAVAGALLVVLTPLVVVVRETAAAPRHPPKELYDPYMDDLTRMLNRAPPPDAHWPPSESGDGSAR